MCLHAVGWPQETASRCKTDSVKLRNAEKHPLSVLIDTILNNDNRLQDVCYSLTVLIFYTLLTMKCYKCSLPKEEYLAICLLISIL